MLMGLEEVLEASLPGEVTGEFEELANFVEAPSAVESGRVRLERYPFLEGKCVGNVYGQTHWCVERNASGTAQLAGELYGGVVLKGEKMLVHVAGVAIGARSIIFRVSS